MSRSAETLGAQKQRIGHHLALMQGYILGYTAGWDFKKPETMFPVFLFAGVLHLCPAKKLYEG